MTDDLRQDERFKSLHRQVVEKMRLRKLSNEELVRDYLSIKDGDTELHFEEMATRLWPDWHKQTGGEET